jgi:hypothetical protein
VHGLILGFSSSPIDDGNVDRMVKAILQKSGKETEFINLNQLSFGPCLACANLCAPNNLCEINDELKPYFPKLIEAEAIVLGTPSFFNNMNSLMAMFLERLWCFRHNYYPLEGKPFAVVSSGGFDDPVDAVEAVKRRMTAYRAQFIGDVRFLSKIAPCFVCGFGLDCRVGSLFGVYGEDGLERLRNGENLFWRWEDFQAVRDEIASIGRILASL